VADGLGEASLVEPKAVQEVQVRRLQAYSRCETTCFHWSGRSLLAAGQQFTPDTIASLLEAGVETVYTSPPVKVRPNKFDEVHGLSVQEGAPIALTVCDVEGRILAREGDKLSSEQAKELRARKLYHFKSDSGGQVAMFRAKYIAKARTRLDEAIANGRNPLHLQATGVPLSKTTRVFAGHPTPKPTLDACEKTYYETAAELEAMWLRLRKGGYLRNADLAALVDGIIDRFCAGPEVIIALASARLKMSTTIAQAVGTSIYALCMALKLAYNRGQARDLVLAALFHDVGYVMMPKGILDKARDLSKDEREIILRHVDYALYLTSCMEWPSEASVLAIYQHHERGTGGGYPRGYTADKIHDYAAVIAAADVLHAFISDRPHRKAYLPADGLDRLVKMAGIDLLDRAAVKALTDAVSLYPIGTCVILSTGDLARVVATSRDPAAPWVGTILDPNGNRVPEARFIDLSKQSSVSIRGEVEPFEEPLAGF
jgi:HD-GYP domain-containing protein (c-di-GMP phosphodiesterase class II)